MLRTRAAGTVRLMRSRLPIVLHAESAKVCYAGPRSENSAPAGSQESHFGRPTTESQITAAQKDSAPIDTKKYKLSIECVEKLVRIPETNVLSF